MNKISLNPLGKVYYFNFNEFSCYKCKYGICPLENLTLDEIRKLPEIDKKYIEENSIDYCTDLARKILVYDYSPEVWLNLNTECGHYSLSDGQHRTCIIACLHQKGGKVKYEPYFNIQSCLCQYCSIKKYYIDLENSLNVFDKLFRTKKFKKVYKYKKNNLYYF
ncbi:MAG: hypothetical protein HFE33_02905 [Clostridia bacterium]|jgi:hypothetical protein|nr:hypothetical protein [Clostridia bacterium]MCI9290745.1 hypothetical protein [Clostridia bacterium]